MALYRCASCGSPNVVADSQIGGISYNYLKGAVGTAVLGAGGAVAGIQNQTQTVYKCPDCGLTLSSPMAQAIKEAIDLCVVSADARKNMSSPDAPFSWEVLKRQYKNIEDGPAEKTIALRKKLANTQVDLITKMVVDDIQTLQADLVAYEKGLTNYDELHNAWEAASRSIEEQRNREIAEVQAALEKEFSDTIARLEEEVNSTQQKSENEKKRLEEERTLLSEKLSSLGLFKFGEKKQTQVQIDMIEKKLIFNAEQCTLSIKEIKQKISAEEKKYAAKKDQIPADIEEKYPLQADLGKRKIELDWWKEDKANLQALAKKRIAWKREPAEIAVAEMAVFYILKTMQKFSDGKSVWISTWIGTEWERETDLLAGEINLRDLNEVCRTVVPEILSLAGIDPATVDMTYDVQEMDERRYKHNLAEKKRIVLSDRRYYIP